MRLATSLKHALFLLVLLPALNVCTLIKPSPTIAHVISIADNRLNLDSRARATPVFLRIYILKNLTNFNSSDFFSLWEKDQQTLGDTLVWREEMMLRPGELRRLDLHDAADGKFIAVVAAFRNIDRAIWRTSSPLLSNKTNDVFISLREDSVHILPKMDPEQLKAAEAADAARQKPAELPTEAQKPRGEPVPGNLLRKPKPK